MVLDNYKSFILTILNGIKKYNIDVSNLDMDHIGYQASSDADYDNLKQEFEKIGVLVSEKIVGGRRVGIYKFNQPLCYQQYTNKAIELIAPKVDQLCPSALEHVEFVIPEGFDSFMNKYPQVPWDTSAINQPEFPMIKLKLTKTIQVKFHLTPVLEIVDK
jgi:predicted metalloenzyme YecM